VATGCGRSTLQPALPGPGLFPSGTHVGVYGSNRRYLQHANGEPFVLIGFGNEGRNSPAVIAQLAGKINYQRAYAASWNQSRSANEYALGRPWPDVNGQSDMSVWNETYWNNLRDYLVHTRDAGITVGLTLWDGHSDLPGGASGSQSTWNAALNLQGIQWAYDVTALNQYPNPRANGGAAERLVFYQRRWIDRLLVEIERYPNVVIELDNETDQAPVAWWLWWADYIRSKQPLVIATTWNASATIPDDVFSSDPRLDMKSYHDRSDVSLTPERYGWNKVIVADADNSCSDLDADTARGVAWQSVLRGGQWNDFVCLDTSGFPDLAKVGYYGILLDFLQTRNVRPWIMAPHDELVNGARCMALPGAFYLVYTSTSVTVDLTSMSGTGTWEWFDPRTGTTTQSGQVAGGAPRTFSLPSAGDYVLWIR